MTNNDHADQLFHHKPAVVQWPHKQSVKEVEEAFALCSS